LKTKHQLELKLFSSYHNPKGKIDFGFKKPSSLILLN